MNLELTSNEDINEDKQIFLRNDNMKFAIEKLQNINTDLRQIKDDLVKLNNSN